jgi:Mrp family chromosome partitioning ATPase/capsular polysaccharide biosynthesis protein
MDLLSYVQILRRRWVLIVAVAVAGVALGAASAYANRSSGASSGRYYKATNLMFIDTTANQNPSGSTTSNAFTNPQQDGLLVTSGDVPTAVGTKLGQNGRQLANQVITEVNATTNTVAITAIARSPGEAEDIANTFASQLVASVNGKLQATFNRQRDSLTSRINSLQNQINGLDAQAAANPGNAVVSAERNGLVGDLQLAYTDFQQLADQSTPTSPVSSIESAQAVPISASEYNARLGAGQQGENVETVDPSNPNATPAIGSTSGSTFQSPLSRGLLGGFLGLLAGVGLALLAERIDRRLRTRDEIEDAFQLPVLAEVPVLTHAQQQNDEVVTFAAPLSRTAEAHRAVRSALLFQFLGDGARAPRHNGQRDALPGAEPANPAHPASDAPLVVLVTSAISNEGKTTTTANLAAAFAESGASVLAVNCDFRRPTLHRYLGVEDEPRKILKTKVPGVTLVSGVVNDADANPAQIIAVQRDVVAAAREHYDVVLLDTAPITTTNDAFDIMSSADAVVLVARPNVTTGDAAARARELLERAHAPLAGVVLVADASAPADSYYYYSSRRSDAARPRDSEEAGATPSDAQEGDLFPDEETTAEVEVIPSSPS